VETPAPPSAAAEGFGDIISPESLGAAGALVRLAGSGRLVRGWARDADGGPLLLGLTAMAREKQGDGHAAHVIGHKLLQL
jgi:hypothetical protein